MAKRNYKYRDFSFNFVANPFNSDVSTVVDEKAISQSIKNIVLTDPGEVPFTPLYGGGIRSILFDIPSPLTAELIKEKIKNSIENYESRIQLNDIVVDYIPDANRYDVYITFTSYLTEDISTISFTLERVL